MQLKFSFEALNPLNFAIFKLEKHRYQCCLVHSLVGKRARAGDDADAAAPVDVARHDADLALKIQKCDI